MGGREEGVVGGPGGSPHCRNVSNTQRIEKWLGNDLFSTWKRHVVSSREIKSLILGQFRVPSLN